MRPLAFALALLALAAILRAAEPVGGPAPAPAAAPAPSSAAPEPGAAKTAGSRSRAALVDLFEPSPAALPGATPKAEFCLSAPDPATIAPETRRAEQAAWRAYYEYKARGLAHRGEVFAWQLASQKAIFVVVLFLVIAGIYFSWLQFRASLPRPPRAAAERAGGAAEAAVAPVEAAVAAAVTELSAGRDGIKVSSPVLGVIILVLSLLFFYLYLVYVYPISEIF